MRLPFLALSYVLGIIVDRLADYLHSISSRQHWKSAPFASMAEYHDANKLIRYHSGQVWQHLEYTRSRMRICRGWSLNCLLLLIGANLWIWMQGNNLAWRFAASGVVSGLLFLIFFGCLFSFWDLGGSYHKQVFETYQLLLTPAATTGAGPPGANVGPAETVVAVRPAQPLRDAAPQPAAH